MRSNIRTAPEAYPSDGSQIATFGSDPFYRSACCCLSLYMIRMSYTAGTWYQSAGKPGWTPYNFRKTTMLFDMWHSESWLETSTESQTEKKFEQGHKRYYKHIGFVEYRTVKWRSFPILGHACSFQHSPLHIQTYAKILNPTEINVDDWFNFIEGTIKTPI